MSCGGDKVESVANLEDVLPLMLVDGNVWWCCWLDLTEVVG